MSHTHTHRNKRARLEVELLEDRSAPVSLWALDMPTSLAVQDQDELRAADVTGLDAAWIPSQPSRRSAAQELEHSAKIRRVEPMTQAPAATVLPELISPESRRLQIQPPAASGAFSWSTGFGTVSAVGDFGSRSLVWSGGGSDSRSTGLLDPYVSRKVDLGPVRAPRALTESGGDVVEQFVDWNADNDNGSEVTEYIPAVRDYEVGFTPLENDVVPLTLFPEPTDPYQGLVQQVYWKLQVSYSGTGRLRFWNSADKQHELTPSDDWQFWPHQIPRLQGEGGGLPIHIEGMEMSDDVGDITINYAELRSYAGVPGWIERSFKPVKVAVTPVVFTYTAIFAHRPIWSNFTAYNDPQQAGDGTAERLRGRIDFFARYLRPLKGEVRFAQNLISIDELLLGGGVAIATQAANYTLMPHSPDAPPAAGANVAFPITDVPRDETGEPNHFYSPMYRQPEASGSDIYIIKMSDNPSVVTTLEDSRVVAVRYEIAFRTVLTWHIEEVDHQGRTYDCIAFLGSIWWFMVFDAGDFDGRKMTRNSSWVGWDGPDEFNGPVRLRRYYANELTQPRPVP